MKVLLLVMKEQRVILDHFYAAIAENLEHCDIRPLNDEQQANLKEYFANHIDMSYYDRIVIFIRCKKAFAQRSYFKNIPNLVFLEHDAWQNFAACKYRGEFTRLYRSVPWARVICSSAGHTQRFIAEDLDVAFVPKGYDPTLLKNLNLPRTIELAFVGSTKNAIYRERKAFLEELAKYESVQVVRTESGNDYVNKLNTIRYFVSADIGMGEYMIKNFEAMACGCVLLAYDQGDDENHALGFKDMVNVVLYRDIASLRDKLRLLRADNARADNIARAGQQLVEKNFTWQQLGGRVAAALTPPLRARIVEPTPQNFWTRLVGRIQGFKQ